MSISYLDYQQCIRRAFDDATDTLKVSSSGSAPDIVDIQKIGGNSVSAGNGTAGTGCLRVTIASDNTAFTVNAAQSGTWNINNVSGTVSLPTGAATSTKQSDGSQKTQIVDGGGSVIASTSNALNVKITDSTLAVTQSGTWNITNVSGTVSLPTGASTEASLAKLTLTQGSTTSSQSGPLIQGAVTTSAPSYTTSQTSPLSLTTAGALRVDNSAVTQPTNVSQINGVTPSMGNGVSGTGVQRVTIASDSTGQIALAAGSATIGALTANQTVNTAQIAGTTTATGNGTASAGCQRVTIASDNTAFTINAAQSGTWNINNISGTISLPTSAATSTKQSDGSQKTQVVDGSGNVIGATSNALDVNIKSLTAGLVDLGYTASEFVRNDYTSTSVTTSAYTQLIASTAAAYQEIEIFDSSGQTLKIAFGASSSEVDKFLVVPGGNGRIKRNVPASTRISIKAVSATASVGEISMNLYG